MNKKIVSLILISMLAFSAISVSAFDKSEFDIVLGENPDTIHIYEDIFAIAYTGPDSDGFIKTVEIDSDGEITEPYIDNFEFDQIQGLTPDIIKVSGSIYAIVYSGADDDGFISTLSINNEGYITSIQSLEFETYDCIDPYIIKISSDIFAIVYGTNLNNDGMIQTIQIDSSGNIFELVSPNSRIVFAPWGRQPKLIHIRGDFYAIAYNDNQNAGFIKTIEIFQNGDLSDLNSDDIRFDRRGRDPDIIHINDDFYAVSYPVSYTHLRAHET